MRLFCFDMRFLFVVLLSIMSAVSFSAQREPDGSLSYAGSGYRAVFSQKDACLSHLWIGGADVMDGHRFYSWCSQIHQPAFFSRE